MKTHILCAMRDSSTLTHMLRMLEDEQECTCRVVRSGEAALLSAKKRRPDVLVIDAVLPLMDGLGVIDRLKEFYGERRIHDAFCERGVRAAGCKLSGSRAVGAAAAWRGLDADD